MIKGKEVLFLVIFGILMVVLVGIFMIKLIYRSSESPSKFFQNVELSLSDEPALNREVELKLTITSFNMPEDAWKNLLSRGGEMPLECATEIILPKDFKLTGGDLSWEGYVPPNDVKEIKVTVKAIKTGEYVIGAWVGPKWHKKYDRANLYVRVYEDTAEVSNVPSRCVGNLEQIKTCLKQSASKIG